ncbi:MAG: glycosyltransferase family 4 protein [Gemmataceae bacterium]|nr:glycosyltransferase family 4 protein [Gemmataceae bacterium]
MRIAYITAGAGGMICGSCLHDNTLAAALIGLGHDVLLIPTYTPIRTDEDDVSQARVFFGGINVYLQQKSALFRRTPWFLDRLFDWPRLLRWVGRFAVKTQAEDLVDLTLSVLRGEDGNQRKEIDKLVGWLKTEVRPDIVILTNVLLSGAAPRLARELGVPLIGMLQGDDIFLEALPAEARARAKELIGANCTALSGYIATSRYYADFMSGYLDFPRDRIDVVYPGINLKGHGGARPDHAWPHDAAPAHTSPERPSHNAAPDSPWRDGPPPDGRPAGGNSRPFTIGYFARICPEKGLHVLVEAFRLLRRMPGTPPCRLHVSGWMGENHLEYLNEQKRLLAAANLLSDFEHVAAPDHAGKVRFLARCDVLSVPTVYREPKGLYILEAWANGVPVVQPRHGAFPELVEATGGGVLVNPEDPADIAQALRRLMDQPEQVRDMARRGQEAVRTRFHAAAMAEETVRVLRRHVTAATDETPIEHR